MLYPNGATAPPRVSSPFGPRSGGAFSFHYGADLIGFTTIRSIAPGLVTFAGLLNNSAGYTVIIDHGDGITSLYMHNHSHHVRLGDRVTEGQPIAVMGDSGNATGDCNHLEIRRHGTSIEPLSYIAARLTATPATTTKEKEEMIVNIQGKAGVRNGGAYYIEGGKATFIGGTVAGAPTLDFEQGSRLAKRVSGI